MVVGLIYLFYTNFWCGCTVCHKELKRENELKNKLGSMWGNRSVRYHKKK